MDKNAIKKYAVWARRELISRVSQRAALYEITEKGYGDANAVSVLGRVMSADEKSQRGALIAQIREKGYEQVMEEIAYTWFNRFIALRFMEVNGYLPSHVRVFTDEENRFKPQILTEAINVELDGLDMEKVYALKTANDDDTLFKYLIIVQCNALSSILPGMFQRISDYTELLFPDNLLREGSVIEQMVSMIPEEDWTDQVQIIGWLYQYYNTEPKDKVFADLKKNIKISKENIPAATQLFTPDWIVRYMVENSLGRLWLEGHPNDKLRAGWKYYLDEAEQEPDVQKQLAEIRKKYAALKPEEIKVIDPCCGSGHILAYMFDVLVQIYEAYGYSAREAVAGIVGNNIWGLDIDDRAAQLAYFSVMMKARQYDRRFFSRGIQPHVYAIAESNNVSNETADYFCKGDAALTGSMREILNELQDAKEYGSILTCSKQNWNALYVRINEIYDDIALYRDEALALLPLVQTGEALSQKYDVVVTNPPYMGSSNMNSKLGEFIKNNYSDYKSDFFSAFLIHASAMTKPEGYCGFFTPYVWMFIQSFEKMRSYLYSHCTIETLIQFEYSAFEEATVPVCTLAFSNTHIHGKKGCYFRLTDFRGGMEVQRQKTLEAIADHNCGFYFEQTTDNFSKIPGSPVAYWVSDRAALAFDAKPFSARYISGGRNKTHNNELYVRCWWEISDWNRWFPYSNGGEYRKWYGNNIDLVDWSDSARNSYAAHGGLLLEKFWEVDAITWNDITSGPSSYRVKPTEAKFSSVSPTLIAKDGKLHLSTLGFLNSNVCAWMNQITNPTLHTLVGNILLLPDKTENVHVDETVKQCINLSRCDWDSFESSWDFKQHPLVALKGGSSCDSKFMGKNPLTIRQAYRNWETVAKERFDQLKANEEELNRIFIDVYGLQEELNPKVEDKDVTVRKADLTREIKSLISYAVGCMFGRYSLTDPGLAYAGGEWDESKYQTFIPDADAILPICDDEYFEDDIVGRFVKFVETVYGKDTLEENLRFIADALGGKGSSREVIRNYFMTDFYADHLKVYQKRPIYWLFDSGRKNGFKCLIYMHRYQPDTIARIRTDYVHEQQSRYRTAIADLESRITSAGTGERVKLSKKLNKLQDQANELRIYEEKIHHLADQMIKIDLNDGVKANYARFQEVLAKVR